MNLLNIMFYNNNNNKFCHAVVVLSIKRDWSKTEQPMQIQSL